MSLSWIDIVITLCIIINIYYIFNTKLSVFERVDHLANLTSSALQKARRVSSTIETLVEFVMLQKVPVKYTKTDPAAFTPTYAHAGDSGMDLYALKDMEIYPGSAAKIEIGIAFQIPDNMEIQIRPRSSTGLTYPLVVHDGTVDNGYRGPVAVICRNISTDTIVRVNRGSRIAQAVLAPVLSAELEEVDELEPTERNTDGFGSTGR